MKNNYLLAMLVALIFVSCSKTEDALIPANVSTEQNQNLNESEVLNKKGCYKEIEGTLTYKSSTSFNLDCGDYWSQGYFNDGSYLGSGNLSHLGKVSSKTKAWATFIFGNINGTQGVIGVHVGYQCCSFVAPNGDEIYLTNDPYDLYMNSKGVATGKCKFYFAGGTGKYKKASGSFIGYVENSLAGKFTVEIDGKLSY